MNQEPGNAETGRMFRELRDRLLFDSNIDAILLTTPEGEILAANPEACRMFGYSEDEICRLGRAGLVDLSDPRLSALLEERTRTGRARGELTFLRRDGTRFSGEVTSAVFSDRCGIQRNSLLIRDITERKESEELRRKELERTRMLLELHTKASQWTNAEIFEYVLEKAVCLTGSKIGYLHRVNDDGTTLSLTAWNKAALERCSAVHDTHYPLSEAGIWADCARLRRPVIHNNYQACPDRKGYPEGHTPLVRHLSLPVIDGDHVRLIIGVGNKESDYDEDDVIQLQLVANELHKITVRRRSEEALKASETRYRVVADNTYDWEFWLDPQGRFVYSSPSCERITGHRVAEFEADPDLLRRLIHPEDRQRYEAHRTYACSREMMAEETFRLVRSDGAVRWIDHVCSPVFDEAGRFLGTRGSNRDVTARMRAEEALRKSEARYRTLVQSSPYCIHEIDPQGRLISMNNAGLAMMGFRSEAEIRGVPFLQAVAEADRQRIASLLEDALKGQPSELEYEAGDGRIFSASLVPIVDAAGAIRRVMGLTQDITKRRQSEAKLLDYQQQLRCLTAELSRAEQHERRRIAALLHDDVIQSLALSKTELGVLRNQLSDPEQRRFLEIIRGHLKTAIQSTRSLTFQLSPPILHELGLEPALDWLCEQIAQQQGLRCCFESDGEPKPMDEEMKIVLFTATRELLLNVVKHARAATAKVTSARENDAVRIVVEDDGSGFDPLRSSICCSEAGGFGLFNIRERLGYLGCRFEIQSKPGKGTRAEMVVPLRRESDEQPGVNLLP